MYTAFTIIAQHFCFFSGSLIGSRFIHFINYTFDIDMDSLINPFQKKKISGKLFNLESDYKK